MSEALDDAETQEVLDVLDVAISDLSSEIAGTDNAEYRRGLEARRVRLTSARGKVAGR
jgi:hypothetical protein